MRLLLMLLDLLFITYPCLPHPSTCMSCLIFASRHLVKTRTPPKKACKWNTGFVQAWLLGLWSGHAHLYEKACRGGVGRRLCITQSCNTAPSCIWAGVEQARCCDMQTWSTGSGEESTVDVREAGRNIGIAQETPYHHHPHPPAPLHVPSIPQRDGEIQ